MKSNSILTLFHKNESLKMEIKNNSSFIGEIFFIEAGIAAGKTTLIKTTEEIFNQILNKIERSKYKFIIEPIDDFTNFNGINPLKEMVEGNITPTEFQIYIALLMIEHLRKNLEKGKIHIVERSPFSVVHIFSYYYYINQKMSPFMFEALKEKYCEIAFNLIKDYKITFIYLDVPSDVISQRIKERNREGEDWKNLDFINSLQDLHKKFYETFVLDQRFNSKIIDFIGNPMEISKYFIDKCLSV